MERTKIDKKVFILAIIFIIFLGLGISGYFLSSRDKNNNEETSSDRVSLKDDFYENINYRTIKKAKIPSDSGSWNRMYDASKVIEERQEELTNEIISDPNFKNDEIDIMLELYNDYEGRNKRGISELKKYIDMVDNAKSIKEFNKVLLTIDRDLDTQVLFNYSSMNDYYDATKTVLFIEPINIDGAPFELFTEKKYERYVSLVKEEILKYFEVLGYSKKKSEDVMKELEDFCKNIQSKSLVQSNITDMFEIYKKYTLNEINKEIKNIPIKEFLSKLKIDKEEFYLIPDMGHYKALDEYYTVKNLPLLKELAKVQIMSSYFVYTTKDNIMFELGLSNKMTGTSITFEEMEKQTILTMKTSYISDELQEKYEEKYFTDEDKKVVADLVEEVRKYYKDIINNSDWLSDDTKASAIKKIDKMKVKIGYQGKEEDNSEEYELVPKSKGGTLISNSIGSNRMLFDTYYKDFNEEASIGSINTLEVNAYYNPQDNSINFLAGFKEIYGNEKNYYKLLGYFGTVIGHEISHAFDNTGSKFDENGKVNDWWSKEDKENYEKLTKKIEEYYSKYEYMGFKVNGKKTLGENIADLAAMKAMISIAESKGATKDDYKKMFEAYADLWASKANKEYAETVSINDSHSPNKVRVNAVLSSMDKFYEVYDIKENDKMFIAKEERVGLW